jgi:hypothetical protein
MRILSAGPSQCHWPQEQRPADTVFALRNTLTESIGNRECIKAQTILVPSQPEQQELRTESQTVRCIRAVHVYDALAKFSHISFDGSLASTFRGSKARTVP